MVSRDFLESNSTSRMIRWVMVLFLLFCRVPQKKVASITNYTDRQVRNINDQFENSNKWGLSKGIGEKREKEEDKKADVRTDSKIHR